MEVSSGGERTAMEFGESSGGGQGSDGGASRG